MSQHTPTPWMHDYQTGEIYHDDDGKVMPQIATVRFDNTSPEQAKADGDLIVRAVNSHDRLIELVEEMIAIYDGDPDHKAWLGQAKFEVKLAKGS